MASFKGHSCHLFSLENIGLAAEYYLDCFKTAHHFFALFITAHSHKPLLTVSFTSGDISLMNNYDDLSPTLIRTGLKGKSTHVFLCFFLFSSHHSFHPFSTDVVAQWCSQGDLLSVAGMEKTLLSHDPSCPPPARNAVAKFYNIRGEHIYTLETPAQVIFFHF